MGELENLWSLCKLADVNKKYPSSKNWRNFDWLLRVLKSGILKI
jgi:hypothetical protein